MADTENCVICKEPLGKEEIVTLGEKGSASVNRASLERNDSTICTVPGQQVHQYCRKIHCNPNKIAQAKRLSIEGPNTSICRSVLRSTEKSFDFNGDCFLCGTPVDGGEQRKKVDVFKVTTIEMKDTILAICSERRDAWSDTVQARIMHIHDLPAADAMYHQTCSVNFRTGKQIPKVFVTEEPAHKKKRLGRPQDEEKMDAFLRVAKFLQDNDDEQITVNDLIDLMNDFMADSESTAYGHTHMKSRLKEHFGDQILITEINGKSNVVTFRSTAETILQEFHARPKAHPEEEKKHIIKAAAKLIKNDIKMVEPSTENYPPAAEIETEERCLNFVPDSLKLLLEGIFVGKDVGLKLASIGQAIMQAARPRVLLAPLQVGLGIQLHHHFASRFLIDSLCRHGFCCSYQEVQRFGKNAAVDQGTDIPNHTSEFVQYVADNVDHNIRTLDGNDTFHGMGIIASVTPGTKHNQLVPRAQVNPDDISLTGRIQIQHQGSVTQGIEIKYNNIVIKKARDPTANLDILWKTSLLFGLSRPAWSGMMQLSHCGIHPGQSSVTFLPMIDMSSSNPTCIFSTLKFASEHARRHSVTPIVTFDQPLWWKALMIIMSEPLDSDLRNIVLRLGGFHTEMSFLGCIGSLMAGSGLKEILEMIYAPNSVEHILTGKAIARAVRAHLLVDAAVNTLIVSKALKVPIPGLQDKSDDPPSVEDESHDYEADVSPNARPSEDDRLNCDLQEARSLFDELMNKRKSAEEVSSADVLTRIDGLLQEQRDLMNDNRTALLWLQCLDMVDILICQRCFPI